MNIVEQSKDILLEVGASPILYLMLALSVASVAVMFERSWFFVTHAENLERLARGLGERLDANDVAGARRLVASSRSAEAAIVLAGLGQVERGPQAASEAMAGATVLQRMRLERWLTFLGTLGNNAPFVGLLGTVIGIVQAFHQLEQSGVGATATSGVMGAIAEALVATAIGLALAIPAVLAFNYFQRRIKTTLGNAEALEHIVLSYLVGGPSAFSPLGVASLAAAGAEGALATAGAEGAHKPVRLQMSAAPFKRSSPADR